MNSYTNFLFQKVYLPVRTIEQTSKYRSELLGDERSRTKQTAEWTSPFFISKTYCKNLLMSWINHRFQDKMQRNFVSLCCSESACYILRKKMSRTSTLKEKFRSTVWQQDDLRWLESTNICLENPIYSMSEKHHRRKIMSTY